MEISEKLFKEIKQIDSIDYWEDIMLDSYQSDIEEQYSNKKNEIFDYFLFHIDEVNDSNKKSFFIDLLSSSIFDTVDNFNKLYNKFNDSKDVVIIEKLIDNFRSWNLPKSDRSKVFSLKDNLKTIPPLLSLIIQSEQKKDDCI